MWPVLVAAAAPDVSWAGPTPVDPFQEQDESELFRFEEQLVTVASRYAQTVRKAPSIVSVVTADVIRERGYRTLSDALRDLPGIYIWRSPEGRDLAAVRGVVSADNNKLLVLVDGMPWYEGVYTHAFIDDYLPISNVRQIEVIKGPGSTIYGTNAFTGVINVVTFSATDVDGVRARWIGGSIGRSDATAMVGGKARVGRVRTSAVAYARVLGQTGAGLDPTPDGARDLSGTDPRKAVNVGGAFTFAGLALQVHHVDYAHTYLFNAREDPFGALGRTLDTFDLQYHDTFGRIGWRLAAGPLEVTPYAFLQHHDNPGAYFFGGDVVLDGGTTPTTTAAAPTPLTASLSFVTVDAEKLSMRTGAGVDAQLRPAIDHVVVAGLGIETVRIDRLFDYAVPSEGDPFVLNGFGAVDDCGSFAGLYGAPPCRKPRLRNLFGYAQYTWTAAASVEVTGGVRVDQRLPTNRGELPSDAAFALSVSPRLGVLLVPTDEVTAKLLYGRAFRAPSVREVLVRASPDPDTGEYAFTSGNLDLRPETIHTAEGELTAEVVRGLELRADGSWSLLDDEIDKVAPGLYCNLPQRLSVTGAEAGVRATLGPASLSADYAFTYARYSAAAASDVVAGCDTDLYSRRTQYEYPPHMVKGAARLAINDSLSTTVFGEVYGARSRRLWSPDAQHPDGAPVALLHASARATDLGPSGRFELGLTVRNVLGSAWNTGVYRDDANELDVVAPVSGEGRSVLVSVEGRL